MARKIYIYEYITSNKINQLMDINQSMNYSINQTFNSIGLKTDLQVLNLCVYHCTSG